MEWLCLTSLDKVFTDGAVHGKEQRKGSSLLGEKFAIQLAFLPQTQEEHTSLQVETELMDSLRVYKVAHVPSGEPNGEEHDQDILKGEAGLFPDVLQPVSFPVQLHELEVGVWHAYWVEFEITDKELAGIHEITFSLGKDRIDFQLEVIGRSLPENTIQHTEWFHTDSLMNYYQVEAFSDRYWELVDRYLEMAVDHSQNMVLTPIFTPPIDTEVGGERPTVQLVDIVKIGDNYTFDFANLTKWSDICKKNDVQYLEIIHLFTQWGAKAAPKIEATVDGEKTKLFGWDTPSASSEYASFLKQFIPALIDWLKENGWEKHVYFHISDEPALDNLDYYQKASNEVKEMLRDFPIIDAMSDYDFYEKGLIDIPVVANNQIDPFLENQVTPLWVYYCGAHNQKVSNRFFDMPSYRNRILGYQLYKYDIDGFLHWGYNFWNTQYSKKAINPYEITDAGGSFPSGDSFLVYPGEEGPLPSFRLKVLNEAFQDVRAMKLIESMYGRSKADELLDTYLPGLTFDHYPKNQESILSLREEMNELIKNGA